MLDRKPSLRHAAAYFLDPAPWAAYFEDSIADNEQPRYADQYEALHIAQIVSCRWENLWQGRTKRALKGEVANAMFFFWLLLVPTNRTSVVYRCVLTSLL
jgi:hypothetical protein